MQNLKNNEFDMLGDESVGLGRIHFHIIQMVSHEESL